MNIWFGLQSLGQYGPDKRLASPSDTLYASKDWHFDAETFQANIQSTAPLGALVSVHSHIGEQAVTYGFAAKPEAAKGFTIGVLYAEALAYARSGDLDGAVLRLTALEKELQQVQGANVFNTYRRQLHLLLVSRQYAPDTVEVFLALFEPLFTEHIIRVDPERLVLFRAGVWLTSVSLAAAAGDQVALRQGEAAQYLHREMTRLHAPEGVLKALEQLHHLIAKEQMAARDMQEVLKLVKRLQTLLG
jgi:hypothetical protein